MSAMPPCDFFVGKFWRAAPDRKLLAIEATGWIALARLIIVLVPFRHIARLASLAPHKPPPEPAVRVQTVKRVRWAVVACARRVPWRAMCYEQGLAAQFMLRRRGIPSLLYYGAAPDMERGLVAHVWVRDGDMDVIGCNTASRYAVLAVFPTLPPQEI